MKENNLANCLFAAITAMSLGLFVWTINTIVSINSTTIPTAISAFNG